VEWEEWVEVGEEVAEVAIPDSLSDLVEIILYFNYRITLLI
jgi:hypothetical protein